MCPRTGRPHRPIIYGSEIETRGFWVGGTARTRGCPRSHHVMAVATSASSPGSAGPPRYHGRPVPDQHRSHAWPGLWARSTTSGSASRRPTGGGRYPRVASSDPCRSRRAAGLATTGKLPVMTTHPSSCRAFRLSGKGTQNARPGRSERGGGQCQRSGPARRTPIVARQPEGWLSNGGQCSRSLVPAIGMTRISGEGDRVVPGFWLPAIVCFAGTGSTFTSKRSDCTLFTALDTPSRFS